MKRQVRNWENISVIQQEGIITITKKNSSMPIRYESFVGPCLLPRWVLLDF